MLRVGFGFLSVEADGDGTADAAMLLRRVSRIEADDLLLARTGRRCAAAP